MNASLALKRQSPSTMEEWKPETAHDQVRKEHFRSLNRDWINEGGAMHGWIFFDTPDIQMRSGLLTNSHFAEDQVVSGESTTYIHLLGAGGVTIYDRAEWKDAVIRRIDGSWRNWPDIDEATAKLAKDFVDALPDDIEEPSVDSTPQGEIDFSWDNDDVTFGVLILPSGDLAWPAYSTK